MELIYDLIKMRYVFFLLIALFFGQSASCVEPGGDTSWMIEGKYGIFMHYQYRILLGYSYKTDPIYPRLDQQSAEEWNQFVDGFDVDEFADQMVEGGVGWVNFCLDDPLYGWTCAPNKTLDKIAGYSPGELCSKRDLIMELADALHQRDIKFICYYAGLNGYLMNPNTVEGFKDNPEVRGELGAKCPPSEETRKLRLEVFREYAERYKDKIDGWWFDIMHDDTYGDKPYDFWELNSIIRKANPKAAVAFSHGKLNFSHVRIGIDDYTGGDTWNREDLTKLTPEKWPPKNGILWHGKIYCGNVYHGQGFNNAFTDNELIDWIKTCNSQGGVCTLDWPFDIETGLITDFGMKQLIKIKEEVKLSE